MGSSVVRVTWRQRRVPPQSCCWRSGAGTKMSLRPHFNPLEALIFLQQHSSSNHEKSNCSVPSTGASTAKQDQRVPEWVHGLSEAGVLGSSLSMECRECFDEKKHGMAPTHWTDQSTLPCCVMDVSSPQKLQAIKSPFPSTKAAQDGSVDLPVSEMRKNQNQEFKKRK